MKTVLHLASSGSQLWCKTRDGWQAHDGPPTGPLWVVSDLAEESFSEIQVPRIFGRDRQAFIARQLASRFPDTPFRTTLPPPPGGSLMERIAPPRLTLLGVDAARRVNASLDALSVPVAGVWAMSMLLANIGCKKTLPSELFVVLPASDGLRIVFIKNRVPALSRLIPGASKPQDQAAEIIRTLRHLENTRVLGRTELRHSVLILGDSNGIASLLSHDHLDLIAPPPPWTTTPPSDWRFALFDLVLTSPAGQLAPLSRRTKFVAARLSQPAYACAALSLGLALWAAGDNLRDIVASHSSRDQIHGSMQKLAAQVSEADQKMAGFGVAAELVRKAVLLDREEIISAPSLPAQMHRLGEVIGRHEGVRLEQLEWRIVPTAQPSCILGAPTPSGGAEAPATGDAVPSKRLAEISFVLTLPEDQPVKTRALSVASLSSMLGKLEGATLIRDPAKGLAQATLHGGGTGEKTEKSLSWCLTLAGQPPTNAPTVPTIQP